MWNDGFRQHEWRPQIYVEDSIPGIDRQVYDRAGYIGPGTVYQHVDRSKGGDRLLDRGLDLHLVGKIDGYQERPLTGGLDLSSGARVDQLF